MVRDYVLPALSPHGESWLRRAETGRDRLWQAYSWIRRLHYERVLHVNEQSIDELPSAMSSRPTWPVHRCQQSAVVSFLLTPSSSQGVCQADSDVHRSLCGSRRGSIDAWQCDTFRLHAKQATVAYSGLIIRQRLHVWFVHRFPCHVVSPALTGTKRETTSCYRLPCSVWDLCR